MKVLIVGGVAGGAGAAARLRRNDEFAEIVLIEKDEYISFANCGLPYYIGGTIKDKKSLTIQTPESFRARFNVDVRVKNEVLSVDAKGQTVEVKNHISGETYTESYDKLILSPGATPVRPPISGIEQEHVFTLRNIPDTYAITEYVDTKKPKTAVVVGAGFIGLEVAENLANLGLKVSVIDAVDHVMPPLDLDMAHDVHNYIRKKGISLHLGLACSTILENHVLVSDGTRIPADLVVMSVGVLPATKFLEGSGIALGERGEILINEFLETSAKDIYALGDAATVTNIVSGAQTLIPLAGPANKQARIVADNVAGKKVAYKGSQGTAIMKFFDMTVAATGMNERELKAKNIPFIKIYTYSASHATYYPGAEMMFIKTLFHPETHKVLGAQIVGGSGVDKRIDTLAIALRFGLTVTELQEMELSYAPPFSSAKDPVNMIGYVAENVINGVTKPYYLENLDKIPVDAIRLDVRYNEELEEDGVLDDFLHIPLPELRDRLNELDLSKPIFVICNSGVRGYNAERILAHHGAEVYNLMSGYRHYKAILEDSKVRLRK